MPLSFSLPFLEEKPRTTQDMVFSVLSHTYPLTIAQLQQALRKQHGKAVSFQAVRKAALLLLEANVLTKEGKKYSLSSEWIRTLVQYSNQLQKRYAAKASSTISKGQNTITYQLNKLIEVDQLSNDIIRENFERHSGQPLVIAAEAKHFWFVLVTLTTEAALTKHARAKGVKIYYANYGGTTLDKWTVDFYSDLGVRSKVLPKPKDYPDGLVIGAFGDIIMQYTYPASIARKMDEFYAKYKRPEDARLAELVEIANMEAPIELTVIKDAQLARMYRERLLEKLS